MGDLTLFAWPLSDSYAFGDLSEVQVPEGHLHATLCAGRGEAAVGGTECPFDR